jgi:hypothetical protein
MTATAPNSAAPAKHRANQPFRIARLIRCITSTRTAASAPRRPGMTEHEYA